VDLLNVSLIRSISFAGVFVICMVLQWIIPSRKFKKDRWKYMVSNIVLVAFNNFIIILMPIIPYEASVYANNRSMGLMNQLDIGVLAVVAGIFLLDIVIYFQHRTFHKVPILWKLHSMHHIDPMLDTTSGLRFHPLEIILSNFIKIGAILILGIAPVAVIIFEVVLNGLAMFNHSNLNIPEPVEKVLNKILITPALHTIHHSKITEETMSNYGFSVPWWDKIFATFCAKGKFPQEKIHIGTVPMPEEKYSLFPGMLVQPFISSEDN
jgi:sterol desaturase/sphingolipid hydroxylase (fatty acid hydroxylase superfamily)